MLTFSESKEQQPFWTKTDIPLDILSQMNCDTYLKADFRKIGKLFQRSTYRTYYLLQNYLLYGDLNKKETLSKCKGYVYLTPVYIEFGMDGKNFVIKLIQPTNEVQLSTINESDFFKWKYALSNKCIMTQFQQDFEIGHFIGKGNFATVRQCLSLSDKKLYAVKIIQRSQIKSHFKREQIMNEIIALRQMNHCNILKALKVYDSKNHLYIVTEYLNGGSLIQKTNDFKKLSIQVLRGIMKSLLEGLAHVHENKIMHRDIKPDNIIFKNKNNPLDVVIIDFGLAALTKFDRYSYRQCGSVGYTAPEVLSYVDGKKMYSGKCDVYSLGITFFSLFYGYNPFKCEDRSQTVKKNFEAYIDFPKDSSVPIQVQKLLENMLKKYPKERYSAQDALQDSFFGEKLCINISFKIPKVILTRKFQIITYNRQHEQQYLLIQTGHIQSFEIIGSHNADHPMMETLFNQIGKSQSHKCILSPTFQRQEDQKQKFCSKTQNIQAQRPKSNTTGQTYYEFVQVNSQDLIKQSIQFESDRYKSWIKPTSHKIPNLDRMEQKNIFKKVSVLKKDYQIKPLNLSSDNLSSLHTQDPINSERSKKFSFLIKETPFQKYKRIGQIQCLNKIRNK